MFDEEYFKWPIFHDDAVERIGQLVREGRISWDEALTENLERELAAYFGVKHALLVNNGTAAAFSAFSSVGLGPGDEIIAPPYSHWATVLPAKTLGCTVVFTDVTKDSLSPSVEQIVKAITPATKALVVCHLYGNPVDVVGMRRVCDEQGLYLIEDASHAVGASIQEKKVGAYGHISFFSMQASKVLAAGEGGCLLTDSYDLFAKAVELGHDKRIKKLAPRSQKYLLSGMGYKFRLSALHTMIAMESFRNLESQLNIRKCMCQRLMQALAGEPSILFLPTVESADRVFWELEMLIEPNTMAVQELRGELNNNRVNAYPPNFPLLPDLPHFKQSKNQNSLYPNVRSVRERIMVLPVLKKPNEQLVDHYASTLKRVLSPDYLMRGGHAF